MNNALTRDDVVIYEAMTGHLDRKWWVRCRTELEQRFRQQEIVVRVSTMERL